MFTIKCDNYIIHDLRHEDLYVVNPKLNLEVNKNGTLTFKMYPSHPYYDKLYKLKSVISVYQDNNVIFKGRIINDEIGFKNEKQVSVEGVLAYLIDSIQDPFEFQGSVEEFFSRIIINHNVQVEPFQRFKMGRVTVVDSNNYINRSSIDYLNSREVIESRLLETMGGYLNVRYEEDGNYIDYLSDFEDTSTQTIEFGENLVDLKQKIEAIDIKTCIIPLGAKLKDASGNDTNSRLTIEEVNSGSKYIIDMDMADQYGKIFEVVIFDDVTIASNLLEKGKQVLAEKVKLSNTIDLTTVDLNNVDKNIESFHFCDYIRILSTPHGIDKRYLLKKMNIDLSNPKNTKITLGETFKTLTDINVGTIKGNSNLKSELEEYKDTLSDQLSQSKGLAFYENGGTTDPNTTLEELIFTRSENNPSGPAKLFFFIRTMFLSKKSETATRRQIAYQHTGNNGIYTRYFTNEEGWSDWVLLSNNLNIKTGGEGVATGRIIDGKLEYMKRIDFGSLPNATTKRIATGLVLENITITDVKAMPRQANGDVNVIPFVDTTAWTNGISIYLRAIDNTIVVDCGSYDRSAFSMKVDIYYTNN